MINEEKWHGHLLCVDNFQDEHSYKYITVRTILERDEVLDLARSWARTVTPESPIPDDQLEESFVRYVRDHRTIDIMTQSQYKRLEALESDDITYILEKLRREALEIAGVDPDHVYPSKYNEH